MAGQGAGHVPVEIDPLRHFAVTQQFGRLQSEAEVGQ